jgi:hypothetical protein
MLYKGGILFNIYHLTGILPGVITINSIHISRYVDVTFNLPTYVAFCTYSFVSDFPLYMYVQVMYVGTKSLYDKSFYKHLCGLHNLVYFVKATWSLRQ